MKVKKNDFIEIDFVAKVKENNQIFDLTKADIAKENNIFNENVKYEPLVVCVGNNDVVSGLDNALEGKEVNAEFTVEIKPEDGFGKKDPSLLKLVNTNIFKKQNIMPIPGLQVNIDNIFGIIRSVSGGRTIVDFNHPLAGKTLIYEVKINKILNDDLEKLKAFLKLKLNLEPEVSKTDDVFEVKNKIPKEAEKFLLDEIAKVLPNVKVELKNVVENK